MCMELLWEKFLQNAYFKDREVDGRITLRCIIGKYVVTEARYLQI
jgi:hypothetical protein